MIKPSKQDLPFYPTSAPNKSAHKRVLSELGYNEDKENCRTNKKTHCVTPTSITTDIKTTDDLRLNPIEPNKKEIKSEGKQSILPEPISVQHTQHLQLNNSRYNSLAAEEAPNEAMELSATNNYNVAFSDPKPCNARIDLTSKEVKEDIIKPTPMNPRTFFQPLRSSSADEKIIENTLNPTANKHMFHSIASNSDCEEEILETDFNVIGKTAPSKDQATDELAELFSSNCRIFNAQSMFDSTRK